MSRAVWIRMRRVFHQLLDLGCFARSLDTNMAVHA